MAAMEIYVRATDRDWELAMSNLYLQGADQDTHEPDPDPDILYRLSPGSESNYHGQFGDYQVRINSLGFRSPERPAEREDADVVRILCLGGSNVYGAEVGDTETWPAQLEARLNAAAGGRRFEVWNLGTSAYVGVQMAAVGRNAVKQIRPDVVLIAPSNPQVPALLGKDRARPTLQRNPRLWELMIPLSRWGPLGILPDGVRVGLLANLRSWRYLLMELSLRTGPDRMPLWFQSSAWYEPQNVSAVRAFIQELKGKVKVGVFILPAARNVPAPARVGFGRGLEHLMPALFNRGGKEFYIPLSVFQRYADGLGVPVLHLDASDRAREYREVHPPARVLAWYGVRLASWMQDSGLVPKAD